MVVVGEGEGEVGGLKSIAKAEWTPRMSMVC